MRLVRREWMVGDRLKFAGEGGWYTVQAVSVSGRWVVATRPAFGTVLYSMIDTERGLRGVDNSLGNSLGYETREACERAVSAFDDGEFGFSRRRPPIRLNIREHRRAAA